MTLALSVITLISLATTGALLFYLARLLRDERERADARVAALASAIHRDDLPEPPARFVPPVQTRIARSDATRQTLGGERTGTDTPAAVTAFEISSMFADPIEDAADQQARRWVFPLLVAIVLVGAAVVAFSTFSGWTRAPRGAETTAEVRTADMPLELLSLRHAREGQSLTVSGLVKNPDGAVTHPRTDVVVFTFDGAGAFLTSVRGALADPALAGGAQAPFSVTIPDASRVNRYRVSFRTGDRVLPHVDRRQGASGSTP